MSKSTTAIDLSVEAPAIHELLSPYLQMHRERVISDADFIAIFILIYLAHRRPRKWCSSFSKISLCDVELTNETLSLPLSSLTEPVMELVGLSYLAKKLKMSESKIIEEVRLVDVFNHLTLSGIKHNTDNYINRFVVMHYLQRRPVCLLQYVPTPMEVLSQQARGERVVTMFLTIDELSRCHVSKLRYMTGGQEHARDPFEFLLHDIRHMEHFVLPETYHEQVGFFDAMLNISDQSPKSFFLKTLGHAKSFWFEMEYVLSDMNCYSTHLLRYLHAKWLASFHSKTQPEEDNNKINETNEWVSIVCAVFNQNPWKSMPEIENPLLDDVLTEDAYNLAKNSAILLNSISDRTITDLTMEQWEGIREYFAWRGRIKLRFCR